MANISGVFANPSAGRLQVSFSGVYVAGTAVDPIGGNSGGSGTLRLRAVINGNNSPTITPESPQSYMELDYPGGSASWSVASQYVDSSGVTTRGYGFQNLRIILTLLKK